MPHKPLEIGVRIVGEQFPRYVIVSNRRRFWTGRGWTKDVRKAGLWAHADLVQREAEELRQKYGG